jgi:hypothetical protein
MKHIIEVFNIIQVLTSLRYLHMSTNNLLLKLRSKSFTTNISLLTALFYIKNGIHFMVIDKVGLFDLAQLVCFDSYLMEKLWFALLVQSFV